MIRKKGRLLKFQETPLLYVSCMKLDISYTKSATQVPICHFDFLFLCLRKKNWRKRYCMRYDVKLLFFCNFTLVRMWFVYDVLGHETNKHEPT